MLPFTEYANIEDQAGEVLLEDCPLRLEQAGSGANRVGVEYDFTADIHLSAADHLLGEVNRRLVMGDRVFKVIDATFHDMIPHLSANLRQMRGG